MAKVVLHEMELTAWKRANGSHAKPATLYTAVEYPSIQPQVGHDVLCSCFGRGRVVEIRDDGILVVRLSHWRLARRNIVTCYVQPDKVQVVRHKKIYEMTVAERIEHGQALKQEASKQFAAKDYDGALKSYAKAVDAVRYVQHKPDSTNEMRADLLILMITCSNNAATCCLQTHQYDLAANYANNAITLIDALEGKKGMKIHTIMLADGLTDMVMFGEYKIKSLLVLAKADYEKKKTVEALQHLKLAHSIAQQFTTESIPSKSLQAYTKEISKLHAKCKEKRQEEKVIEKKRAKAMFATTTDDKEASNDTAKQLSTENSENPRLAEISSRASASPTSVVDGGIQNVPDILAAPASPKQKIKKRVSFSSNVKSSKEDAEDAFFIGLGVAGLALVVGAAVVGARALFGKQRS
ncbi:hypothetical protein MPSEU_000885300 [Mayamaea pseudoterrestris]|nr:hypothetical protein MPSEU_000885300 [Mayamaea pseudoterrestris]